MSQNNKKYAAMIRSSRILSVDAVDTVEAKEKIHTELTKSNRRQYLEMWTNGGCKVEEVSD